MTEEQRKTKFNLMKILSLVCLVVVIVSGFLPWVTLEGDYKEGIFGEFSAITDDISDEDIEEFQAELDAQDVEFDLEEFVDSIEHLLDPITDGDVSPMDFLALNTNFNVFKGHVMKATELEDGYALVLEEGTEEIFEIVSTVILVPVGVFGVLAFAALIRFILRLFNRRGLGVFVAILSALNVLFMGAMAVVLHMVFSETGSGSASLTLVPIVVFVCSILGCVFWGQARKLLNPVVVKEVVEIPVPQNIPTPQGVPVPPQAPVEVEVEE